MDSSKLPITGPCPIDLDAIGFDRGSKVSHCSHCDKNVHNLSMMTERDAKALLDERAGTKLCVTYARDKSGKVQFKPEPAPQLIPLGRLTRRPAAAAAGLGLAMALAACTPHAGDSAPDDRVHIEAGGIGAPEPKEPCDNDKTKTKQDDREPLEVVEGGMPIERPLVGELVAPPEEMVDGEIELAVPEAGQVRPPHRG